MGYRVTVTEWERREINREREKEWRIIFHYYKKNIHAFDWSHSRKDQFDYNYFPMEVLLITFIKMLCKKGNPI